MFEINQITSEPLQTQVLTLYDGTLLNMTLYYVPRQLGWFITNLTIGNFTLQGVRITTSPNILYQWKDLLNFGLACFSTQNREPTQQQDFSSGASALYILTASEVQQYSEFLSGSS